MHPKNTDGIPTGTSFPRLRSRHLSYSNRRHSSSRNNDDHPIGVASSFLGAETSRSSLNPISTSTPSVEHGVEKDTVNALQGAIAIAHEDIEKGTLSSESEQSAKSETTEEGE